MEKKWGDGEAFFAAHQLYMSALLEGYMGERTVKAWVCVLDCVYIWSVEPLH